MEKPNLKNPEDYSRLDNLTQSLWAWEFLRRNTKYREEYERYVDANIEEIKNPGSSNADELCGADKWDIENGYHDPENDTPDIKWLPLRGGTEAFVVASKGWAGGTRVFGGADYETGEVMLQFNFRQPLAHQFEKAKKELSRLRKEAKKMGIKSQRGYKSSGWEAKVWSDEWKLLLQIADAHAAGIKD